MCPATAGSGRATRADLSAAEEGVHPRAELDGVLEEEPVAGVGVDAQLRVGQVLGQQERVLGGGHLVVVAVGDQNGLLDGGQALQAAVVSDAPGGDRDELGVTDGESGRGVPFGRAQAQALEELPALGLLEALFSKKRARRPSAVWVWLQDASP